MILEMLLGAAFVGVFTVLKIESVRKTLTDKNIEEANTNAKKRNYLLSQLAKSDDTYVLSTILPKGKEKLKYLIEIDKADIYDGKVRIFNGSASSQDGVAGYGTVFIEKEGE